jgi:predicted DNA-binding transcriptional regulator
MNISEIKLKLENAQSKLEEIKTARAQYQEALRNLDLNEAGWLGYIEALTPYVTEATNESDVDSTTHEDV